MSDQQAPLCSELASNDPAPCVLDAGHHGRHQDAEGHTWQYSFKYGRADVYEITWMSGHIETVLAHQLTYPHQGLAMAGALGIGLAADSGAPRIRMHAEIDGRWCLTLAAREEDIRTIRIVTQAEQIPGGGDR